VGGRPLYQRVARLVAEEWSRYGECGLVVGATYPEQLGAVRSVAGDLPILLPGVGAQQGDLAASVRAGVTADGLGLLASASRSILYASRGEDFAEAARAEAIRTREAIEAARHAPAPG
jgi:orotidine-5'-phosphate decarboxylase